jgi:hypothetical protein
MCAVQERQYSPLVSEPRPAAAPNRGPQLTMPLMSITVATIFSNYYPAVFDEAGAFMTPQL